MPNVQQQPPAPLRRERRRVRRSGDYAGVGALLKRERLHQEHNIAQVADQLRIRYLYLEALEERPYAELPAPAYVNGLPAF